MNKFALARCRNQYVDSNIILKEKFFLYFVFNEHYQSEIREER